MCPEEPTQPCSSASAPSSGSEELLSDETDESSCAAVGARASSSSSSARLGRIVKQQQSKPEGVCRRGWSIGCCAAPGCWDCALDTFLAVKWIYGSILDPKTKDDRPTCELGVRPPGARPTASNTDTSTRI